MNGRWKLVRDVASFGIGAYLAIFEIVTRQTIRWEVLAFAAGLMGLAPFLRGLEVVKRNDGEA